MDFTLILSTIAGTILGAIFGAIVVSFVPAENQDMVKRTKARFVAWWRGWRNERRVNREEKKKQKLLKDKNSLIESCRGLYTEHRMQAAVGYLVCHECGYIEKCSHPMDAARLFKKGVHTSYCRDCSEFLPGYRGVCDICGSPEKSKTAVGELDSGMLNDDLQRGLEEGKKYGTYWWYRGDWPQLPSVPYQVCVDTEDCERRVREKNDGLPLIEDEVDTRFTEKVNQRKIDRLMHIQVNWTDPYFYQRSICSLTSHSEDHGEDHGGKEHTKDTHIFDIKIDREFPARVFAHEFCCCGSKREVDGQAR